MQHWSVLRAPPIKAADKARCRATVKFKLLFLKTVRALSICAAHLRPHRLTVFLILP